MHMTSRMALGAAMTAALMVLTAAATVPAGERKPELNLSREGVAIRGYDAVAYVTDGRAVAGSRQFEARWKGAIWRFASADHRETFLKEPERYAPQFGGYCAYAVSQGYTADGDPQVWRTVNGRLYLNYSTRAQRLWERDVPGHIVKGHANWPGVLEK
jgi:hypothetical protein